MTAEENLKEQYRILGLPSFDGLKELLKLVGLAVVSDKILYSIFIRSSTQASAFVLLTSINIHFLQADSKSAALTSFTIVPLSIKP